MKNYLALLFLVVSLQSHSQNTLKFNVGKATKASIKDVSWIAGHWVGEAFGGQTEELWSAPLGDSMMGSFKLVAKGTVEFYELCTISEENGTLFFRLKHFHKDLKGWEEKDERLTAQLVKIEGQKAYFNDFTFERISKNELNIYVVFKDDKGVEEEMKFSYKLKKS